MYVSKLQWENQEKTFRNMHLLNDSKDLLLYCFFPNLFLLLLLSGNTPSSMEHTPVELEHRFFTMSPGQQNEVESWKFPSELALHLLENKTTMENYALKIDFNAIANLPNFTDSLTYHYLRSCFVLIKSSYTSQSPGQSLNMNFLTIDSLN